MSNSNNNDEQQQSLPCFNSGWIKIRGAREHNLKSVDVDIPKYKLVVVCGVSGSGKSTLAFDIVYSEGQRRYVDSMPAYVRQFLERQDKPDVDNISGLSPAISISQKSVSKNPRSTVATITEIYDYLRVMYARIGTIYSPSTGKPVVGQTVSSMVAKICTLPITTKLCIMAPIARGRKGEYRTELLSAHATGYNKFKINGQFYSYNDIPSLDKNRKHNISVVIDRIIYTEEQRSRIAESMSNAVKLGEGIAYVELIDCPADSITNHRSGDILTFSEHCVCPESGFTIEELEPRLFSFNSPNGMCQACGGLGLRMEVNPELILREDHLSLYDGVVHPAGSINEKREPTGKLATQCSEAIITICNKYDISKKLPWSNMSTKVQNLIMFGDEVLPGVVQIVVKCLIPYSTKEHYYSMMTCSVCKGSRLRYEALAVKINDTNIWELSSLSVQKSLEWIKTLSSKLDAHKLDIAGRVITELEQRLQFLSDVGLDYLTLNRSANTLSGGESQRIRLASQISSGLTGIIYVMDEPSIGLHQVDTSRLINTMKNLRDTGNTVIVVEHDEDTIDNADFVIDIGPGAGRDGGYITAVGTPTEIRGNANSLTGDYLSGRKSIPVPKSRRPVSNKTIEIVAARANNLRNINVSIPIGCFVCFTGPSGSGKSTLITETLYKYAAQKIQGSSTTHGLCNTILGLEYIDKVIDIDQNSIGRTPFSNPVTYTGIFTYIRQWFAGLAESKARGYDIGRFSFNTKGGRCEVCRGEGHTKISMNFLPDVYVKCEECNGSRFNAETVEIKYKGASIVDVLSMTIDQAVEFFDNIASIRDKLIALQKVGLGYISLGQSGLTLSGGEAQRIKLSKELLKNATGNTLYILDEPTTGLHFDDINKLLIVLHHLVDRGNTVVLIEHNLHVIKTADYIIDMGPGGGDAGGYIVATGTPEEVAMSESSITGKYLHKYLYK